MSSAPVKILEWKPSYSILAPEIDQEHQVFFGFINRLHEAMLAGCGKDILGKLLTELVQYTYYHFAHEEELMAAIGYPGLDAHVQGHNNLRDNVKAFADRFKREEISMTVELTLFLNTWLAQHILTSDRMVGEYLRTRKTTNTD